MVGASQDRAVWYFAYASNMHPERRRQRAELRPLDEAPGRLDGFALVFDMPGVPPAEPSMANLREQPGAEVHGLLLQLSAENFEALLRSEGGAEFYRVATINVCTYEERRVEARTLIGLRDRVRPTLGPPSRRYMNLIREGARHCGLDPAYRATLDHAPESLASPAARWCSELVLELYLRASHTPLSPLAHRYLRLLQETETLAPIPRAVLQALTLAPAVAVGAALRLIRPKHRNKAAT